LFGTQIPLLKRRVRAVLVEDLVKGLVEDLVEELVEEQEEEAWGVWAA
jgi:hypothetical protein